MRRRVAQCVTLVMLPHHRYCPEYIWTFRQIYPWVYLLQSFQAERLIPLVSERILRDGFFVLLHLASNLFIFVLVLFSFVLLYFRFFALSTICSRFHSHFVHFRRIVCFYSFVLSVLATTRTQGHIFSALFSASIFPFFHKIICAVRFSLPHLFRNGSARMSQKTTLQKQTHTHW